MPRREMLPDDESTWPIEPLVALESAWSDERGDIQPLVDTGMRSAVLISSKKGSVRANHYHKTDWHFCYVVSGAIEYFYRKTGSNESPNRVLVPSGQMVFTPPMVDHAMKFHEDTVFLTLSRNPRNQAAYEADVVRTNLTDA